MLGLLRQVQGWVKIRGDTDGTKIGNVGDQLKVNSDDSTVSSGLETTTILAAGQTVELKIGVTAKTDRKFVIILAKGNNIKFGFSSPASTFDALNNQLLILPFGANTTIYVTNTSGTSRTVVLGEV